VVDTIIIPATAASKRCYIEELDGCFSTTPSPAAETEGCTVDSREELQRLSAELEALEMDPDVDFDTLEDMGEKVESKRQALLTQSSRRPGAASVFLSHSWQCPWWSTVHSAVLHSLSASGDGEAGFANNWSVEELLDRLQSAALQPHGVTQFYWVDIFSKNQHVVQGDETMNELARAVACSGEMVLSLHPWPHPVALTRVWCLYEVMTALESNCKLTISPSYQVADTLFEARSDEDISEAMAGKISIEDADATVESDRVMILNQVEQTLGFGKMNDQVRRALLNGLEATRRGILSSFGQTSAPGTVGMVGVVKLN
jgi:hypothetical protein